MTIVTVIKLGNTSLRVSPQDRLFASDVLNVLGLRAEPFILQQLAHTYNLDVAEESLSNILEPTLTIQDFITLITHLQTAEAKRLQSKLGAIFQGYLEGDARLAAEIVDKSPAEDRRWLLARLESIEARKRFTSVIGKHGGEGDIFRLVSSLSNQSVLSMNSQAFRQKRGVKNTRDGMTAEELLRLSYLETASTEAIEKSQVYGNEEILALHRQTLDLEKQLWNTPEVDVPRAA
jgi:hypothetical protein